MSSGFLKVSEFTKFEEVSFIRFFSFICLSLKVRPNTDLEMEKNSNSKEAKHGTIESFFSSQTRKKEKMGCFFNLKLFNNQSNSSDYVVYHNLQVNDNKNNLLSLINNVN